MKKVFLLLFVSVLTLNSCDEKTPQEQKVETKVNKKVELEGKIKALEETIFNKDNSTKNIKDEKEKATKLLSYYTDFYNLYSEDPKGGDYLFKAGNIALGLGKTIPAIQAFRNAHDAFPGYKKRVEAVYMVAFIYDNNLHKKDKAREFYNFIIENYPEHQLAKDAIARLNTLEMTDEELIKLFEKKNATK